MNAFDEIMSSSCEIFSAPRPLVLLSLSCSHCGVSPLFFSAGCCRRFESICPFVRLLNPHFCTAANNCVSFECCLKGLLVSGCECFTTDGSGGGNDAVNDDGTTGPVGKVETYSCDELENPRGPRSCDDLALFAVTMYWLSWLVDELTGGSARGPEVIGLDMPSPMGDGCADIKGMNWC